jgi:mxaC protein
MGLALEQPWVLLLLPLMFLPFWARSEQTLSYSTLDLLPRDALSELVWVLVRLAVALAIAALVLGLGGLHKVADSVERIGRGAHIVLLLDRSLSMEQPFTSTESTHTLPTLGFRSKGQMARTLMAEFAARRSRDLYGVVVFSTNPIPVLPLTGKQSVVQAAIAAGNVGRGLSQTDVGAGIEKALAYFEDRPYAGSRIILLVSDGAARIDVGGRLRIRNLMKKHRAALYWIFLRSTNSPGLDAQPGERLTLEQELHTFFQNMSAPYRAYMAENPADLERAIEDVGRLQNLPIRYREESPRRDFSALCFALAAVLLTLVALSQGLEISRWD